MDAPKIIDFPKVGDSTLGYLSIVQEGDQFPFEIKRIFWAYFTPEDVMRGYHAHYETEMVIVAASGKIIINTEMLDGSKAEFTLERPNVGLYVPRMCWHTMKYTHNAVQLVITSSLYAESDYIRDYNKFLNERRDSQVR